jgi:hypothetical protein
LLDAIGVSWLTLAQDNVGDADFAVAFALRPKGGNPASKKINLQKSPLRRSPLLGACLWTLSSHPSNYSDALYNFGRIKGHPISVSATRLS